MQIKVMGYGTNANNRLRFHYYPVDNYSMHAAAREIQLGPSPFICEGRAAAGIL